MKEEIIIDGVNVTGCEFIIDRLTKNHDYTCKRHSTLLKCTDNKDC